MAKANFVLWSLHALTFAGYAACLRVFSFWYEMPTAWRQLPTVAFLLLVLCPGLCVLFGVVRVLNRE
jgi:hypothetical protein